MAETQTQDVAKKESKPKIDNRKLLPVEKARFPEVGKEIIEAIQDANKAQDKKMKAEAELNTVEGNINARMVETIYKMSEADPNFVVGDTFKGREQSQALLTRAKLCLGVMDVDESSGKVVPAKGMEKYFPKGDKQSPSYIKAKSLQSNLSMRIKRACEQVQGFYDQNAIPKRDPKTGHLIVENAPKQIAGPDTTQPVVLDGKKRDGAETRATVSAFGTMAKKRHSASAATAGKQSAVEQKATDALKSEDAFGKLCATFVRAVNGLEGKVSSEQRKQLNTVKQAVDKVLASGEKAA